MLSISISIKQRFSASPTRYQDVGAACLPAGIFSFVTHYLHHILILVCVFAYSALVSAEPSENSQSRATLADPASAPLAVVSTDELYKPATLPDGRLIAVALPTIDGVQQALAIYS